MAVIWYLDKYVHLLGKMFNLISSCAVYWLRGIHGFLNCCNWGHVLCSLALVLATRLCCCGEGKGKGRSAGKAACPFRKRAWTYLFKTVPALPWEAGIISTICSHTKHCEKNHNTMQKHWSKAWILMILTWNLPPNQCEIMSHLYPHKILCKIYKTVQNTVQFIPLILLVQKKIYSEQFWMIFKNKI